MADFLMPSLGADMEAGRLLEWYVKPGDAVKRGDIVALVDTDKAAIEIEIFEDGVVGELLIPAGEKVPVGSVLATIEAGAGGAAMAPPEPVEEVVEPVPVVSAAPTPPARPHGTPAARAHALERGVDLATLAGTGRHGVITAADVDGVAKAVPAEAEPSAPPARQRVTPLAARQRVSPLARRTAEAIGVELAGLSGSGPNGVVTQADVERAAEPAPTAPRPPVASPQEDRSRAMRRAIAAALGKSKREIPHYYLSSHVDMSTALSWLEEENLGRPITERLVSALLLLKATALAAREVPDLNGFWIDDEFRPSESVHLGVGISLRQGGLIAPAIHDADRKDLDTLMADLRDLVKRARALQLRSSEMTDATLTVTNLGEQGVEEVYGIIYPPQVALVGFGKVLARPWAERGMVGVRPVVQATLAADHRASDGHRGGLFLTAIDRYLQTPEAL